MTQEASSDKTRRKAIKLVAGTAGTLAFGQLGLLTACGGARAAASAISRLPLAAVPLGERVKFDHHGESVELLRSETEVVARSLVCTHEFCALFWHGASNAYRCRCHGAQFTPDGQPRSGPISAPMWTLPARVEGDEVVVGGRA